MSDSNHMHEYSPLELSPKTPLTFIEYNNIRAIAESIKKTTDNLEKMTQETSFTYMANVNYICRLLKSIENILLPAWDAYDSRVKGGRNDSL